MVVRRRRRQKLPSAPDLRKLKDAEASAAPEQPTIIEMIRHYLDWKSGKATENTIKAYTTGLRLFSRWLSMGGVDPFTDMADAPAPLGNGGIHRLDAEATICANGPADFCQVGRALPRCRG
jgi:hypothetical protein